MQFHETASFSNNHFAEFSENFSVFWQEICYNGIAMGTAILIIIQKAFDNELQIIGSDIYKEL